MADATMASAKTVQFAEDLDALMAQDSLLPSVPSTTLHHEVRLAGTGASQPLPRC